MGYRQIFTCLFLLTFIPLSAKALPPPSPAGGNYLVLDGVDDYAVLDFETNPKRRSHQPRRGLNSFHLRVMGVATL